MADGDIGEEYDKLVSIDEAREVLAKLGVTTADAEKAFAGLHFPAPLGVLLERLRQAGLDTDDLSDRLGGSP